MHSASDGYDNNMIDDELSEWVDGEISTVRANPEKLSWFLSEK